MFGVVFFTRFQQLEFSVWKASVLLAVLFSMFCYALDLDRLGKAFSEAQAERAQDAGRLSFHYPGLAALVTGPGLFVTGVLSCVAMLSPDSGLSFLSSQRRAWGAPAIRRPSIPR